MTIEKEDRENLILYRLEQAEETVRDVKLLIENDRLRSAVNRIYYGMFYSLLALGLAFEFEREIVLEMFDEMQEFISSIKSYLGEN